MKGNISYTWRMILSVKHLIKKGARRVIGDGKATHFGKDPWIPELPGECILPWTHQKDMGVLGERVN